MFLRDIEKFKHTVEKSMYSFFRMVPEEVENNIKVLEQTYIDKYDLDVVEFINVPEKAREDVLRYRTLKYFYTTWKKVVELESFLKTGEEIGLK